MNNEELKIGENTKMCEKCHGFHTGLTCRQYASRDEMNKNAFVTVGVLCEYLEELERQWKEGRPIVAASTLALQCSALLKQVMEGPLFTERVKEKQFASNVALRCFADAKNLATFIVPKQWEAPFVAATAAYLERVTIKPSERENPEPDEDVVLPLENKAWSVREAPTKFQSKDVWQLCWDSSLFLESVDKIGLRQLAENLNRSDARARENEAITRNYNQLVHALGGSLYGAKNPEEAAKAVRAEHDRLKAAVDTLTATTERECKRAFVVYHGDSAPHDMADIILNLRAGLERERLNHEKTKHEKANLEVQLRNKTAEGTMELTMRLISLTVNTGTHHTGKRHSETPIEKVVESIAGEVVELACALNGKGGTPAVRRELADVFIAFVHAMAKTDTTQDHLAYDVVDKLQERNSFDIVFRPEFDRLKREVLQAVKRG